jgi:hypothetical protein
MNNVIDFEHGKFELVLKYVKYLLEEGETFNNDTTIEVFGSYYIVNKILSIDGSIKINVREMMQK